MIKKKNLRSYVIWLLLVLLLLWVDLLTKYLFYNFQRLKDWYFIEPAINIGVSFSLHLSYIIVIPLSLLALVFFFYLYSSKQFSKLVTILLMAGTLGNFYDRVMYDGVRDFMVMPWFFIYNIADIFLTVWMCFALYDLLIHHTNKKIAKI